MPLTPAGLLGFPTAPGHRPPLFYTKLKISFYKRFRVSLNLFQSRTQGGGEVPPVLPVEMTCGLAPQSQPCLSTPQHQL